MKQKSKISENKNLIRILTVVIGLPIVMAIFILGNKYIIDILVSIVAIISMYEYFHAIEKKYKPVEIVGYVLAFLIAFIHIIPVKYQLMGLIMLIPTIITILFIKVIVSKMKTNFEDIAVSLFGILYILGCIVFLPLLYATESGKILIWYIFIPAWGSDTCAYLIGRKFGKKKLSIISPKKTVEGSIGGIIGVVIIGLIYTICINNLTSLNINYLFISIVLILLGALSQIGDLAASTIKRHCDIKDFGNIIPGHGGMLDRIDSLILITPFAYFLLKLIII